MASRELSCFLCREMLYEFQVGALDERRRHAVERHLSVCQDCTRLLQESQRAAHYLGTLTQSKISTKAVNDLKGYNPLLVHRKGWRRLPESLRWGLEALLVALIIAAGFHFGSQWFSNREKTKASQVVLAEGETLPGEAGVSNLPEDKLADVDAEEGLEGADKSESGETEAATEETPQEVAMQAAATTAPAPEASAAPVETPAVIASGTITPADYKIPQRPLVLALNPPATPAAQAVAATVPAATPLPAPKTASSQPAAVSSAVPAEGNGFVYRMAMSVRGVDRVTPELKSAIEALDGQKAGQVQLGWKKPGGSYFHFTLPEANFDSLMKDLRAFAQVRHSKDPHKRVMPPGTIRIILWVEELDAPKSAPVPSSAPDEADSEAPAEESSPEPAAPDPSTPEENE
ncbi:MAG TPA: zf-HC2 domain-containing protein [Bdellovibrionales bacterium]|nr:zf-HC2 domain-containing protein [Bdellovibrionales bacterium]